MATISIWYAVDREILKNYPFLVSTTIELKTVSTNNYKNNNKQQNAIKPELSKQFQNIKMVT